MGLFSGKVGFVYEDIETDEGTYVPNIVEKHYKGNTIKTTIKNQTGESINDAITLNNRIEFMADIYATNNFASIAYIKWRGYYWKVTSIDVDYPMITCTIGEIYNGRTST